MNRHWLFVILLFSGIAIATASFATGQNGSGPAAGEHNSGKTVNCGEDQLLSGDEC